MQLTIEDLVSIKIYITQLLGDLFIFENLIMKGNLVFYIKGKIGPIPEEIALAIIEELAEYKYASDQIEVMGYGNAVIVTGRGER